MNGLLQKASEVNRNGAINDRSIPYSNLSEDDRVRLAADAVTAVHPYVPTVKSAAKDFGITPAKISAEIRRREEDRKEAEAERILFAFADLWAEQSFAWRVQALRWISTQHDCMDINFALSAAAS